MLFVDLKTAFDNVKRDILWRELRRREIKEMLIRRLKRIYEQKLEVDESKIYREFQNEERSTTEMCGKSIPVYI